MSEEAAYWGLIVVAFAMGVLCNAGLRTAFAKRDTAKVKIECDNSQAIQAFAEATQAARLYSALLDEVNAKSLSVRRNIEAIRPIRDDLH